MAPVGRERGGLLGGLALFVAEFLGAGLEFPHGFLAALRARPFQLPGGAPESLQRRSALGGPGLAVRRRGSPHLLGCLLEPTGRVGHALVVLFAGQPFQLAGRLLGFLSQLALARTTSTAAPALPGTVPHRVGHPLGPLVLLLLPAGELTEPLQGLVELSFRLLAPLPLDRLVLVPKLVGLQFEQVGQFLGVLLGGSASPTTLRLIPGNLNLAIGRLGPLEMLERPLRRGQRLPGSLAAKLFLGFLELDRRGVQLSGDRQKGRIDARDLALAHPGRETRYVLPKPAFANREGRDVFPETGGLRRAVAEHVECADHDLPLPLREPLGRFGPATATAATLLFSLAIRLVERPDLEEVHVALAGLAGAVDGLGVVRHQISRRE